MARSTLSKYAPALVAGAAAAAAGYYFYASKHAKRNRRIVAKWATDLKDEVVDRAQGLTNLNRSQILNTIDTVASAYERMRGIRPADVRAAAEELRENWSALVDEVRAEMKKGFTSSQKSKATRSAKRKRAS